MSLKKMFSSSFILPFASKVFPLTSLAYSLSLGVGHFSSEIEEKKFVTKII